MGPALLLPLLLPMAAAPQEPVHGFEARELERADGRAPLRYRLRPPTRDYGAEPAPLLLFLHGAGERGDDNLAQLVHFPERLARPDWAGCYDGWVLAPQCPEGQRWVEASWSDLPPPAMDPEPSPAMGEVLELMEHLLEELNLDRSRLSLVGLSMGAQGAWELAVRRPQWFAALAPVCGGADPRRVEVLQGMPVFAWHGIDDPVVPLERSGLMVEALRAAGGTARLEVLPEGTGHAAWDGAFAARSPLWPWLRSARRGRAELRFGAGESFDRGRLGLARSARLVLPAGFAGLATVGCELRLAGGARLVDEGQGDAERAFKLVGELVGAGDLRLEPGVRAHVIPVAVGSDLGGLVLHDAWLRLGGGAPPEGWRLVSTGDSTLVLLPGGSKVFVQAVEGTLTVEGWSAEGALWVPAEAATRLRLRDPQGHSAGLYRALWRRGQVVPGEALGA